MSEASRILLLEQQVMTLSGRVEELMALLNRRSVPGDGVSFQVQEVEVVTDVQCSGGNVIGTTRKILVLAEDA
jgi:hypothetical protein